MLHAQQKSTQNYDNAWQVRLVRRYTDMRCASIQTSRRDTERIRHTYCQQGCVAPASDRCQRNNRCGFEGKVVFNREFNAPRPAPIAETEPRGFVNSRSWFRKHSVQGSSSLSIAPFDPVECAIVSVL